MALGVDRVSRAYEADPLGAPGTPRFVNAAVAVRTSMDLVELKYRVLRPIEARLGRVRTWDPNAPRTIDIDIAMAGLETLEDSELRTRVPDPDIPRHGHLLRPLRDLEPDLLHPEFGATLDELADALETEPGVSVREDLDLEDSLLRSDPDLP